MPRAARRRCAPPRDGQIEEFVQPGQKGHGTDGDAQSPERSVESLVHNFLLPPPISRSSCTARTRSIGRRRRFKTAMFMHLDQTLEEATHQLKGDYAASVKDYDHLVHHILGATS